MNKIAAFLFWGFFGTLAFIGVGAYLGSRTERPPQTCTTPREAMLAADEFNRKFLSDPDDYERTGVIVNEDQGEIRIGLIYRVGSHTGRVRSYRVAPDCAVSFI